MVGEVGLEGSVESNDFACRGAASQAFPPFLLGFAPIGKTSFARSSRANEEEREEKAPDVGVVGVSAAEPNVEASLAWDSLNDGLVAGARGGGSGRGGWF